MRVAIVHDWLVARGGAERTLERMIECYPQADLFALVDFMAPADRAFLQQRKVSTSFLQNLPFARSHYRHYLPLMPLAAESLDLSAYDLVISSSFCAAKGVLTGPDQVHVSYVHSPMRYAWDLQHQYLRQHRLERGLRGCLARKVLHDLRTWDVRSANGVDSFLCNSRFIAGRIWKTYRREAEVIHPPVDTEYFRPAAGQARDDFYFTASRLVPYKCVRLIVDAFARESNRRLVVIGDGPELAELRRRATPNVELLGYQPNSVVREYLQRARAFLFAAYEDFGIAPVEAQACGTPVVAYGRGGAAETIVHGRTGILFPEQSAQALLEALEVFERRRERFSGEEIRANAARFGSERFKQQFRGAIEAQCRPPRLELAAV